MQPGGHRFEPGILHQSIARGWRGQPGRLEVLDTRFVFVEFRGVMLRIDI